MRPLSHRPCPAATEADAIHSYGAALAIFFVCAVILASPWLTQSVTIPWDAKAHFQAQFAFLARSLHEGQSPFWTPNVFDGSPQIADPQSLIFAPAFVLAALFGRTPDFRLEDATVFAMLFVGGLGVIGIFRDRNLHPAAALLAALAFAFGGSAAWRIQHIGQIMSLAWFPSAFWALSRALDRRSAAWGLAAGALSAFLLLGRDQVAFLEILLLVAYTIMRALRMSFSEWRGPIAGGFIAGTLIAALPLALTLALATQSNRPEIPLSEAVRGSLHPASFLTLASANLFHSAGPLELFWGPPSPSWGETGLYIARNMMTLYMGALAIVSLATLLVNAPMSVLRNRDIAFLAVATIILALYAFGRFTPAFALLFEIPGVDLFRRPADATFPLCALLAILSGYALHHFCENGVSLIRASLVTAVCLALCVATALAKDRLALATPALIMSMLFLAGAIAVLAICAKARRPLIALVAVGLFTTLDLAVDNAPNESTGLPPSDYDMLHADTTNSTIAILRDRLRAAQAPDRRDRMEFAGLGFAWPNASLVQGFENDLGYNPIRTALLEGFTGAGDHVALPEQRVFSKAFPSYHSVAANLTGLRYIATGVPVERIDPLLKPGDLNFVAQTTDGFIYENPHAMPRVLVATKVLKHSFDDLIANGDWPDADYSRTVLLQQTTDAAPRRDGSAKLLHYENTAIEIEADAPDGGWLVLNDVWHPWWRVEVDGADAAMLRANGMFRAVALAPGHHDVRFSFHPVAGLFASLSAAVLRQDSSSPAR